MKIARQLQGGSPETSEPMCDWWFETTLRNGDTFTLATDVGSVDLLGTPSGTGGYDDLARSADVFRLFGHRVLVASVDDLIRMKRAAGRPKDLLAVEELGALREELDRRDRRRKGGLVD